MILILFTLKHTNVNTVVDTGQLILPNTPIFPFQLILSVYTVIHIVIIHYIPYERSKCLRRESPSLFVSSTVSLLATILGNFMPVKCIVCLFVCIHFLYSFVHCGVNIVINNGTSKSQNQPKCHPTCIFICSQCDIFSSELLQPSCVFPSLVISQEKGACSPLSFSLTLSLCLPSSCSFSSLSVICRHSTCGCSGFLSLGCVTQ